MHKSFLFLNLNICYGFSFFLAPKTYAKVGGYENITNFELKMLFIQTYVKLTGLVVGPRVQ